MADLEKTTQIAKETMEKISKESEAKKAQAETKGAAAEKSEKAKTEGINFADKAEAQAKEDERILSANEADLSEKDKERKVQLGEIKKKKDESPEEKIKRVQESSQKRIDEIKSELLEEKNRANQDRDLIKRLEAELAEVKKSIKPKEEDAQIVIKRQLDERIAKYVDEDKSKPRAERREMSKEELDEWFLEDPTEASAWINDRSLRRHEEKKEIQESLKSNKGKELADDFVKKQKASFDKLLAKYPRVKLSEARLKEVDAMLTGKNEAEQRAILEKEEPVYLAALDLINTNPKKYLEAVDGPEAAIIELDKKFGQKDTKKTITLTEDELQERIKAATVAEAERIASLEGEGLHSTSGKQQTKEVKKTDFELKQLELAQKAGLTEEQLNKANERRKSIPGASVGRD